MVRISKEGRPFGFKKGDPNICRPNNKGRTHSEATKEKHRQLMLEENNPLWKGDSVGNKPLHRWVRSRIPVPEFCELCRVKRPYHLSNRTGVYSRKLENWWYLCVKCHSHYDHIT